MVKTAVMLADGVEESEAIIVIDLLRRSSELFSVTTFSITDKTEINSSHGIRFFADKAFDEAAISDCDMIFLPGGGKGTQNLAGFAPLHKLLKQFADGGKVLAAICAAPLVLDIAGVLAGKQYTCYPGIEQKIAKTAQFRSDMPVVQDGLIFTSRGMGTAIDLGLALTRHFSDEKHAAALADQIIYRQ